jgi:hypothetical protein
MSSDKWKYDFRCYMCGRFIDLKDCDSAVPYGSYDDIDEPEEQYFCKNCVEDLKEEAISNGYLLNCFYRPPKYYYEVAEVIGWERRENGRWYKKDGKEQP